MAKSTKRKRSSHSLESRADRVDTPRMLLIDASNAEDYLRHTGRIAPDETVRVRELAGGVSNVVLLVSRTTGEPRFVVKQVREQLRVPEPWYCSIERIWREVDVLEVCHRALAETSAVGLPPGEPTIAVPRVLFCDRDNYLFAMSAVPDHEVWKAQLLRGEICLATAAACGRLLGTIHAATWQQPDVAQRLGDTSFFDALRLDPYYRHVARSHADVAPALQRLVASLAEHPRCLVHGDFSPKNILVHRGGLTLVDFEVGHFGDPAFDLGLLSDASSLEGHSRPGRMVGFPSADVCLLEPIQAEPAADLRCEGVRRAGGTRDREPGGLLVGSGGRQEPSRLPGFRRTSDRARIRTRPVVSVAGDLARSGRPICQRYSPCRTSSPDIGQKVMNHARQDVTKLTKRRSVAY